MKNRMPTSPADIIPTERLYQHKAELEKEMETAKKRGDSEIETTAIEWAFIVSELIDAREILSSVGNPRGFKTDLLPAIKFLVNALPHSGPPPGMIGEPVLKDSQGKVIQADWHREQRCGHCDFLRAVAAAGLKLKEIGDPPEYLKDIFTRGN